MEALEQEIERLLEISMSKGTNVIYKRNISRFKEFRSQFGLDEIWPYPIQHIAAYIAHLSLSGLAASTINVHTASISYIHKVNGWQDPTDNFLIQKLKEGCKRQNRAGDLRYPITLPILKRLMEVLNTVCRDAFESFLFKAVFLVAFFGFLRVSEFAKTANINVTRVLDINDITFLGESQSVANLQIRYSKTDQQGLGSVIQLCEGNDKLLCPVTALKQYLSVRPFIQGPLFLHFDSKVLLSHQVTAVLKKSVTVIGLDPALFSSHSFRIGAATSASLAGISIEEIKNLGRWRSDCVEGYIRPSRVIDPKLFK